MNSQVLNAVLSLELTPHEKLVLIAILSEVRYSDWKENRSFVKVSVSRKVLNDKSVASPTKLSAILKSLEAKRYVYRLEREAHIGRTSRRCLLVDISGILSFSKKQQIKSKS